MIFISRRHSCRRVRHHLETWQVLLHAVHLVETVCQCNNLTVFVLLDHDIAVARLALGAIKRHEASQEVLVARLKRVEGTSAARLLLAAVQVKIRCRVVLKYT